MYKHLDINNAADVEEIVKGCAKNDRRYQQVLYNQTFTKMLGVCQRYSADYDEAMDYLQDGYIKVFEKIDSYEPSGSLLAWVRTVIVNNIIDDIRRKSKFSFSEFDTEHFDEQDDTDEELESIAENEKNANRIVELLQELSPSYRTVFNMFVVEDMSHKDIADALGISIGTSKSNLAKAKIKLKELYLKKYGNIYE